MKLFKIITYPVVAALFACGGSSAFAGAITNLDDQPHTVTCEAYCPQREITIKAGETWRINDKVKIVYKGQELWLREEDEYAIWKNDGLSPQRRIIHTGKIL